MVRALIGLDTKPPQEERESQQELHIQPHAAPPDPHHRTHFFAKRTFRELCLI